MTEDPQQPDWNLLPTRPREFFALAEEFERKELKRAYNRLIRIYKPEKHPAEFQKVRAAYEQLDRQLRYGYGAEIESHRTAEYQWVERTVSHSQAIPTEVSANTEDTTAQPRLELHERLDHESPQTLYQQLSEQPVKDPYDYYALALLADVVDRKNPHQFAHWLLKGLAEYPRENGLLQLMRDYLREVEPSPTLAKLLIACSKAVPTDNFYPLTEPAWENLLREADFDSCIATLKQCQANLRDIGIGGQLIFMIRMLRFGLWRDKTDWKDVAIDFLEENFEQIPQHMEFELEILTAAHRYIATREQFLNGNPLRQQIDQAMQSYFTLDLAEGDQAVLQCQLSILDQTDQLLAAFHADSGDDIQAMYTLWDWLSADVSERYGVEQQGDVNTNLWLGRCSALLKQCRAHTKASASGWRWQLVMIGYLCFKSSFYIVIPTLLCGFLVVPLLARFPDSGDGPWPVVFLSASIAGGLYAARKLSLSFQERFWHPYCERQARRNYDRFWRRELLDFLDRSQLNFHLTTQMMAHTATEDLDTWVCHFMQQDYALAIFATARRFLI